MHLIRGVSATASSGLLSVMIAVEVVHVMTFFNLFFCSHYEVKPSHNDLLNHMGLMGEAATRDAVLAKSKVQTFSNAL